MATAPSANDLTRQQLDELDDLLQRMLNLPLTGTEPPPPAAPSGPTWRYDAPAAPPAPTPHLVAPPAPTPHYVAPPEPPRPPAVALVPPPRPEPFIAPVPLIPPPEPTIPVVERKPVAPPKPAPKPVVPVVTAPLIPAVPVPAPTPVVYEPAEPLPVVLWPLAAIDWVFSGFTRLLGPVGWLLRSWFGKNLIGLAGIGLIAYTTAHLATEAGWVQLPFPVPWPK